ncbi:MAG: phosphatase PAP2 family protein [Hymenobacteraceae bacterium]|nr:phosphatase PAP2 family protein [Hymenobacteraceae bacterium]
MIHATRRRLAAALALLTLETVLLLGAWLACVGVVLAFGEWWLAHGTFGFDAAAFELLAAARGAIPGLTPLMVAFTWIGTHYVMIPLGLSLLAWFVFRRRHRWHSWRVPVVALGSTLLNGLLKVTYHRPRPLVPHLVPAHGLSFPSGHAMVAASFWGLLWWLARRHLPPGWLRTAALWSLPLVALLIGGSRVYLGVHYASDVVAGFAAGLAWLGLALTIIGRFERRAAHALAPTEPLGPPTSDE